MSDTFPWNQGDASARSGCSARSSCFILLPQPRVGRVKMRGVGLLTYGSSSALRLPSWQWHVLQMPFPTSGYYVQGVVPVYSGGPAPAFHRLPRQVGLSPSLPNSTGR